MVFHDWQRSGSTSVKLSQNTHLLEGFVAMTELSAYVDFPVLLSQKRDQGNTRSSSVAFLSRPELGTFKQFLHLLIGNSSPMDYVGNAVRSQMDFVDEVSSSPTCKTTLETQFSSFLFLLWVSKIWCHQD